MLQLFWLGGIGFSNAIIWAPFIKKAIVRAASFSIRHHRIHLSSNNSALNNSVTLSPKDNGDTSLSPSTRIRVITIATRSGGVIDSSASLAPANSFGAV